MLDEFVEVEGVEVLRAAAAAALARMGLRGACVLLESFSPGGGSRGR